MGARKAVQFTRERQEQFLGFIREGAPCHVAAAKVGVKNSTVRDWITTGSSPETDRTKRRRTPEKIAEAVAFVEAYHEASEIGEPIQKERALFAVYDAGVGGDTRKKEVEVWKPKYTYDKDGNRAVVVDASGDVVLELAERRVERGVSDPKAMVNYLRLRWPEEFANRSRVDVTTREELTDAQLKRLQDLMRGGKLTPEEIQGLRGTGDNLTLGRSILKRLGGGDD
jgi:hypothetical protein